MIERRGGKRIPPGGKPAGKYTNEALGLPEAKRVTLRFYPDDLERVELLINAGYGANRTDVVRTAILDAIKRG